jgi:hypothetical protein
MHLDAEVASIDVVSEEEVAGIGWFATDFEQLHEIILQLCLLVEARVQ